MSLARLLRSAFLLRLDDCIQNAVPSVLGRFRGDRQADLLTSRGRYWTDAGQTNLLAEILSRRVRQQPSHIPSDRRTADADPIELPIRQQSHDLRGPLRNVAMAVHHDLLQLGSRC